MYRYCTWRLTVGLKLSAQSRQSGSDGFWSPSAHRTSLISLRAMGLFGKEPAPPPPEPTPYETAMAIMAEYPNLTTTLLIICNLCLFVWYKMASTTKPAKGEAIIRMSSTGIASLAPTTLCKLFDAAAKGF